MEQFLDRKYFPNGVSFDQHWIPKNILTGFQKDMYRSLIGGQQAALSTNQSPNPNLEPSLLTIFWPMQLKYKKSDLKFIFFLLSNFIVRLFIISGRVGWSNGADNNPSYIEFYWNAFDRFSMLRTIFVLWHLSELLDLTGEPKSMLIWLFGHIMRLTFRLIPVISFNERMFQG